MKKLEEVLMERSGGACELCGATAGAQPYDVLPQDSRDADNTIMACSTCRAQVDKKQELDNNHWKVLATTMWSEVPGVQVIAWRMLNRLQTESWAADSLDLLYLDDETLAWAKAGGDADGDTGVDLHKDAYGALLQAGDTVILTKSLDVKGSTLNAKLGTAVRNIRLVPDNTEQIEGKIEGQTIVILTKYVRRQG